MKHIALLLVLSGLVGCGVDGDPIRPTANAGVTVNSSGIYPSVAVGLNSGPLWLRLGL